MSPFLPPRSPEAASGSGRCAFSRPPWGEGGNGADPWAKDGTWACSPTVKDDRGGAFMMAPGAFCPPASNGPVLLQPLQEPTENEEDCPTLPTQETLQEKECHLAQQEQV